MFPHGNWESIRERTVCPRASAGRLISALVGTCFDRRALLPMQNTNPISQITRIYETSSVPTVLLKTDKDLISRFLGDDLKETCESAADTRAPVLISTAGLPLENRKEALRVWRADCVRVVIESSESAKNFVQFGPPEFVREAQAGNVSLSDLKDAIENHIVGARVKETDARRKTKGSLRKMLRGLIRDVEDKHAETVEPRWMVLTPSGETTFWRYERRAKEFGFGTGTAFFIFALDPGRSAIKAPRSGWSEAVQSEFMETVLLNKPVLGMSSEEIEDMEDQSSGMENDESDKGDTD